MMKWIDRTLQLLHDDIQQTLHKGHGDTLQVVFQNILESTTLTKSISAKDKIKEITLEQQLKQQLQH